MKAVYYRKTERKILIRGVVPLDLLRSFLLNLVFYFISNASSLSLSLSPTLTW